VEATRKANPETTENGNGIGHRHVHGQRLLVVSHPAVVNVNQEVYRELARRGWKLEIVVPSRWRHSYSRADIVPRALPGLVGSLRPTRVAFPGYPQRHLYVTRSRALCRRARPDVAFVEAEPYSLVATQWSLAFTSLGVPFGVQCYENIDRRLPPPVRWLRSRVLRRAAFVAARSDSAARLARAWGAHGEVGFAPPAVPSWEREPRAAEHPPATAEHPLATAEPSLAAADLPLTTAERDATEHHPSSADPPSTAAEREDGHPFTERDEGHREDGHPFTIGYAGRLVQSKGLIDLLEAVRMLAAPVELVLIGNGELREQLEHQPIPGSHVRVLDGLTHEQMARGYARLDVLVLPSRTTPTWKEQFGRAIVEALWCGVPVVGSDSGEIPWLIELTGGGLVFAEGDREALAARLTELREHPELRQELAMRGRARVQELFSVPAATDRLERMLALAADSR
jgi:glycosyltransferase involved in cell wall biosynthesis